MIVFIKFVYLIFCNDIFREGDFFGIQVEAIFVNKKKIRALYFSLTFNICE